MQKNAKVVTPKLKPNDLRHFSNGKVSVFYCFLPQFHYAIFETGVISLP